MKKYRIHHYVPYTELASERAVDWYDFFTQYGVFPEINFSAHDLDHISEADLLRLEADVHSRKLGLSLHAPYLDLSPGAFDPKIREVTLHRLEQALNVAEILRPHVIDIHPHYDRNRFQGKIDAWLENCLRTFEPVVKRAETLKVFLAMENVFDEEPEPIARLVDGLASPFVGACFDNGHFHMFHKVSLRQWWNRLGKQTILLHLHDNHGERDEHLPIGEASFPFPTLFNLLREQNHEITLTLESRNLEHGLRSLKALRRHLDGG